MLKMRLGSGWLGGPSPIFLFYGAESADLNEGSLRARHAKARLRARGHLKSFDTPGFWGGVSKIFMTLSGWDFRCVQQPCPIVHTAVPPIVHTAMPRENNEHGCVYLRYRAVCKLPGCVEGHPWHVNGQCWQQRTVNWSAIYVLLDEKYNDDNSNRNHLQTLCHRVVPSGTILSYSSC